MKNFTGIDSAYEPPQFSEIHLKTVGATPEVCVDQILHWLHLSDSAVYTNAGDSFSLAYVVSATNYSIGTSAKAHGNPLLK